MANHFFKRVAYYVQRHSYNIQLRAIEYNLLKIFLPRAKFNIGINSLNILKEEDTIVNELKKDGISDLGITISEDQINSIINELKKITPYSHNLGKHDTPAVDLNNVGKEVQLAHYRREELAKISAVMKIANDSKLLNVVTRYLGVKPTISNVNCWWSFGDRESAKDAQFYHRDMDDYRFLKAFIYLTDVNDDNGPHIYVKGSHISNKLTELRRFSDNEVKSQFESDKITTLTKQKGNMFIEDTYGIHKGQLPLKGTRLILQIQYSFFPLHVEDYRPHSGIENLQLDSYVNRLLYTK